MKSLRVLFLAVTLIASLLATVVTSRAHAQGSSVDRPPSGGPRRQLGTIIYAGLGGAVLGLSTLSFYGRPQDKLANIAIGFAVGVIGGTMAVTYNAATNPDDFYGLEDSRSRLLGPSPLMTALQNTKADESSPALSASFEF